MAAMSVSVFISSTGVDLDKDCRPCVRRAITEGGAIEVCMESWVTDFDEAEHVCRRKLRASSHYLGIFAHWRGSSPPGQERSYTEAEFDWACELKKTKAVLLPKASTEYDLQLRERANTQDARAAEAQKNFVKRVRSMGVAMDFEDLPHLAQKAAQVLDAWLDRGIMRAAAGGPAAGRAPTEAELVTLGRRELVTQFERTFDIIGGEGLPEVVGFLVHGPVGYGHAHAVRRLREIFEEANGGVDEYDDAQPRRIVLPSGGYWDGDNLRGLLSAFGRQVDKEWEPPDIASLAARVRKLLESEHLVLEINDLQRYGSVASFVAQFWQPLADALGGQLHAHKLVAFMSYEGAPEPDWDAFTFDPTADDDADFAPARPVKLPALAAFTAQELTTWLRGWLRGVGAHGGNAQQQLKQAQTLTSALVAETGGEPLKVYSKLNTPIVP